MKQKHLERVQLSIADCLDEGSDININRKEDIFHEYYLLFTEKIDYDNFINKYNFDYMVVNKESSLY